MQSSSCKRSWACLHHFSCIRAAGCFRWPGALGAGFSWPLGSCQLIFSVSFILLCLVILPSPDSDRALGFAIVHAINLWIPVRRRPRHGVKAHALVGDLAKRLDRLETGGGGARSLTKPFCVKLAKWSLYDRTLRPQPGGKEYVSSSLLRKGSWIAVQSVPEFGVPSRTSPRGPSKCRVSVQNLATATVASTTSWPEDVLDWPVVGLRHTPWVQTSLRKMQCPPKPSSVLRGRIHARRLPWHVEPR